MMIANGVKYVIEEDVLILVCPKNQFAQKANTVILMTKLAFYHADLIRIVPVAINALRVANV